MFDTVLVADRGESARRVLRTCQRLGIKAVAVHSDNDVDAPHATEADESVLLGGSDPYADGVKVLEAARTSRAQAVHPGSGVLAQDAGFAQSVLDAGLAWVGAPPEVLRAAAQVAPPAPAGRRVTVLVLGPVVVGEREQTVPGHEEAPAALPDPVRVALHARAASAAADLGVDGLASLEIAVVDGEPVLLAVHLGLQAADVVVELVTGLDLAEQQLLVAAGEPPATAAAVRGHAVVRLPRGVAVWAQTRREALEQLDSAGTDDLRRGEGIS